jgi:hypothetical protein
MKRYIYIALCLFCADLSAQNNLVFNGSFEEYDTCGFIGPEFVAKYWRMSPYLSTPDYFNLCKPLSGGGSIPINTFGYQYPFQGNGYIGFVIGVSTDSLSLRECAETTLSDTLIVGALYRARFYINRAENNLSSIPESACNRIGIKLSTVSYSNPPYDFDQSIVNNISQVYTNDIITDTSKWVKVEGTFIADSAYTYLNIGNFFKSDSISHIPATYSGCCMNFYYFVDSISLTLVSYNGLEESKINNEIILYPNPGTNNLNIQKGEGYLLSVYDVIGKELFTQQLKNYNERIDMSNYNKGLYFIKLNKEGKETYIEKFIKQ